MFDLEQELDRLRTTFNDAAIPYALCGGMAMIVHDIIRSTVDIDFLVRGDDLDRIYAATDKLGFSIKARPMLFDGGRTQIRRVSNVDVRDGDTLILDLLLVTPASEEAWASREKKIWRGADLWVVSPRGLIDLKRSRSSDQDLVDIKNLEKML